MKVEVNAMKSEPNKFESQTRFQTRVFRNLLVSFSNPNLYIDFWCSQWPATSFARVVLYCGAD